MNVVVPGTLDLFTRPAVQLAIKERNTQEFRPVVPQAKIDNPVEFNIHSAEDEMIDLSETRMRLKIKLDVIKIKKSDGSKQEMTGAEWNKIFPISFLLNTLWKQIDRQINDRPVTNSQQMHGFKSYIDTLTGFSSDSKAGYLTAAGWVTSEYDGSNNEIPGDRKNFCLIQQLRMNLPRYNYMAE